MDENEKDIIWECYECGNIDNPCIPIEGKVPSCFPTGLFKMKQE